jgi:hypothetical protein
MKRAGQFSARIQGFYPGLPMALTHVLCFHDLGTMVSNFAQYKNLQNFNI